MRRIGARVFSLLLLGGAAAAAILALVPAADPPSAPAPSGREPPSAPLAPPSPEREPLPAAEAQEQPAAAQESSGPTGDGPAETEPPNGILVVRLLDPEGKPITRTSLVIERENPERAAEVDEFFSSGPDEHGIVRFEVPPGTYRIYAPGHVFNSMVRRVLRYVEVPPGTLVSIDVFVTKGPRSLSGNLVWAEPMGSLRIRVLDGYSRQVVAEGLAANLAFAGKGKFDPEELPQDRLPGYFRIEGLQAQPYVVSVFPGVKFIDLDPSIEARFHPVEIPVDLTSGDVHLPWRVFWPEEFGLPPIERKFIFQAVKKLREQGGEFRGNKVHAFFPDTQRIE